MIERQFIAKHLSFKGEDITVEECLPVEITELKNGMVEISFNIKKSRHYLKFPVSEFKAAIKEFKKEYSL